MTTETLPARTDAYLLQAEDGERIENLGLRLLITGAQSEGALLAAVCANPGPGGPPLHTHAGVDELYYVLAGRYRFRFGDRDHEGGPGTFVWAPRGTSHTFASLGPEEGRILAFTLPATEAFLHGISALQEAGMDQRTMVEHFRAFDSSIDGPPLV